MRKDEAFLSRSISYGRDESEDLYWEMMSSFSHNSSLRKVDRCSKMGSAPEMKAILEAQFRKKRLFGLCSLRSWSGTDSLVSDNEFSHTHSSMYVSFTNEMREQEEEMFDLPSWDAHMEYSFDNAKDFIYFPENEMVEEHSDNLGSSFLMDSRLEIEVDEVGDHGASNLDVAGVTNQSIALLCDKHRVDEEGVNADTWSLVSPSIPEKLYNRYKDELQDAREDTINGLKDKSIYSRMGVKRMGNLITSHFMLRS
ncbi:protein WVD2-like 7 [Salvia splendens]|uniref:protein WVD2-like 7 n=1 Tax=Salvia splendens TaxID=180675 RepID=UPI001C263B68|nr:protein WVD2-like 7 [Salvia splendens]